MKTAFGTLIIGALMILLLSGPVTPGDYAVKHLEKKNSLIGAEIVSPCKPIPVKIEGKVNLFYEIHITNMGRSPLILYKVEAFENGSCKDASASYQIDDFPNMLSHFNDRKENASIEKIERGERVVAFIRVKVDEDKPVPDRIFHKITFAKDGDRKERAVLYAPEVKVDKKKPYAIKPPLYGEGWLSAEGPVNIKDYSHHRFGVITTGGKARVPQRYAIDWMKYGENGMLYHDDPKKNENWYCHGEKIHAVADGVVLEAKDGIPENVPLKKERAVKMTMDTLCGNYVLVDMEDGRCALYAHMIPGSVKVKPGDKVKAGQVLGLLGNSGNSDAPHLHFHISTKPEGNILGCEGAPYVFERFEHQGTVAIPFPSNIKTIGDIKWNPIDKDITREMEIPPAYKVYRLKK